MQPLQSLVNKHKGATIHIMAGGPSLNEMASKRDWSTEVCIGVNGTPQVIGGLTYWLRVDNFSDSDADKWQVNWIKEKSQTVRILNENVKIQSGWNVDYQFKHSAMYPTCGVKDISSSGLFWWGSSTHAAVELALHMGASRVVLWGLDCDDSQAHAYPDFTPHKPFNVGLINIKFAMIRQYWGDHRIFNANPKSKISALQFIKPETVLPGTYKSDKPKVIGVKPIIVCMTLTGDRPWCLSECCKRYFKRFIKPAGYEYKWLVLDNGQEAFNPKGCEYVRRPVGDTFQAGVRTGILHAQSLGADYIVIMEDDDWYSPQRLVKHIAAFEAGAQLHGYTNSIYYNVKERLWNQHHNHKHSSFHDMAFTRSFSNEILTNIIQPDGEQPFIDLVIWSKYVGTSGVVLDANCKNAISLKAMPGRKGILGGSGHTIPDKEKPAYHADPEGDKLAELIGIEDAKLILDKMLVDRIAELEKLVPTNKVPMVQSAKQRGRPKKVALVTQEQPQTVTPIDSRPMAPIPADAGAPIMDVKSQTITGPSVPVTYNLAGKDSRDPESQRTVMLPEVMLRGFNIHKFEGNILGGKK